MKNSLLLISLVIMTTIIASAQDASDYYPMKVGNYWIMSCDTLLGEYNPTIFRQDVEGTDLILDEEYFRIKHSVINGFDWSSYFWFKIDSTGLSQSLQPINYNQIPNSQFQFFDIPSILYILSNYTGSLFYQDHFFHLSIII